MATLTCLWCVALSGQLHAVPTALLLNSALVMEGCPPYTLVGTLSAVDANPRASHFFSLVAGQGSTHNGRFYLYGHDLLVGVGPPLDFETQPALSIRVRVTDSAGAILEREFVVPLTDDRQEDSDGDDLTEETEEDHLGTSDLLYDSDGDGIGDGAEVAAMTSPLDFNDWPESAIIGWGHARDGEQAAPPGSTVLEWSTGQGHTLAINADGSVVAWGGHNSYGQNTVPADLGEVIAVAAGGDYWVEDSAHNLALKSDGTVVAWGYDQEGQIVVPAGLDQVVAIAAGRSHCLALKNNGTVVAWGCNPHGNVEPPAGLRDVVAISAGGYYSLALKSNGTVVAWGSNFNGTYWEDAAVPVGLSDVVAIDAGRFHSLALKNDGTVAAWGYPFNGQTTVPAGLNGVVAVAAGGFHSLALKDDGTIVTWGDNSCGQTTLPTMAQSEVRKISAGILHSLAQRRGTGLPEIFSSPRILAAPGDPVAHQIEVTLAADADPVFSVIGLPDGLTVDPASGLITGTASAPARRSIRIQVQTRQGLLTQMAWVGISEGHPPTAVALDSPGVLENSAAGTVVGILSAVDPDVADSHTFEWVDGIGAHDNRSFRIEGNQLIVAQALTRDFEQNPAGFSLRIRARDASLNPHEEILTLNFLDDRTEDADGDGWSEALEEDIYQTSDARYDTDGDGFGDVFEQTRGFQPENPTDFPAGRMLLAWGANDDGQTLLPPVVDELIDLAAGGSHNLALKRDGTVLAWGANGDGQTTLPEGLQDGVAVAAGDLHSLVLKSDGTVVAWGNNDYGQISVPAGLIDVIAIAAGAYHNLALTNEGMVVTWGDDTYRQATVPAELTDVVAIAAGGFHSLALKSDGTVVAWGSAWGGAVSVPAGLSGVIAIAAGGYHGLALQHDGTVVAWGSNAASQTAIPAGLGKATAIAAGWLHSLALMADGSLAAWGDSTRGQTAMPPEARQIRKIAAGNFHNLALRQASGFPAIADDAPIRSWPGETVAHPTVIQSASPTRFTAIGLPPDLTLDPATGVVTGTVATGTRRAVRFMASTDQGPLSRVLWSNTADGVPPDAITLSATVMAENTAAGTVVATLNVTDPNAGDSHTLDLAYVAAAPDSFRFYISGNQLLVRYPLSADYDDGKTTLMIRVVALDSANNTLECDFVLQLTDDRLEDADGDGLNETAEEDVLGTSDAHRDDFNTADPDHDGVPSLFEHAFNLNPKTAGPPQRLVPGAGSTAGLPAIELIDDPPGRRRRLRIEYLRRIGSGLTYTPEFGGALVPAAWAPASQPVTVTPVNAEWERCVVEDSLSTAEAPCRFGRVTVKW